MSTIRNDDKYSPKIFPVLKEKISCAICYYDGYLCGFGDTTSGICLQSRCNLPNKNCGIYGDSYMSSDEHGYLNGG